jgi:formyltetrahydrofolate synthetase
LNVNRRKTLNQGSLNGGSAVLSLLLIISSEIMIFLRTDSQAEWNMLKRASLESGASYAVICNHWAQGGAGASELADAVIEACNKPSEFRCSILLVMSETHG